MLGTRVRWWGVLVLVSTAFAQAPAKKRIAVFDFDNAAVESVTMAMYQSTGGNVGKAMTDLVIAKLVQDGGVTVIERSALDKLIAEQNLTNSDRTDPQTAAKLGRILGVDAIVLGTVTRYENEDKTTGGGGSPFGGFVGRPSMSTKHDLKAAVQVTARIVSPDTAEVLAVSQGAGEIVKKGVKVDMRDASRGMMGASGPSKELMNEATGKAVAQLATQLEVELRKLPARTPVIEGVIADVNETGRLVINIGSRSGVKPGDKLQLWRAGKEIRDPTTGKLLMRDDTALGEAVVTTVNENFSIAEYKGASKLQVGDLVCGGVCHH
jgi:curli biogenesis system outer membrane secretion channel CsgG